MAERASCTSLRSACFITQAPAVVLTVCLGLAMCVLSISPAAAQRCPDSTYWRSGRCRADEPYPYNRSEVYRQQRCLGPYNYCAILCRQDYVNTGLSVFRKCMDRCEREYESCEAKPFSMDAQ